MCVSIFSTESRHFCLFMLWLCFFVLGIFCVRKPIKRQIIVLFIVHKYGLYFELEVLEVQYNNRSIYMDFSIRPPFLQCITCMSK